MITPSPWTAEQLATWRATLDRRSRAADRDLKARRARLMAFAREAARRLRADFGAEQVLLFGSLAHGHWFSETSDVDLAVKGLDVDRHLLAIAHLTELAGDIQVDLVRLEWCSESLRGVIDAEGMVL